MTRDRHSYPSDEVARTAIPGRPAAEREKDATEEPGAADEPDRGAFADLPFGHRATAPLIDSDELLGLPAEEPPARFALERGAMVGQYELIRPLGRGGMGTVFLARDTRLGRRVAIKFLVHEHPELVERFQAEARITARCRHENIVIIHDIGELAGYSYMALEYIEGLTLRDWLVQRWSPSRPGDDDPADRSLSGPSEDVGEHCAPELSVASAVSATLAAETMVPVVRALAHAHSQGLVHRDLKPANIMLDSAGTIKVLDFGLATVADSQPAPRPLDRDFAELWSVRSFKTRTGAFLGTLPYMSPEQWGAGAVDERSDIWAVGVILWELITGRHPLAPLTPDRLGTVARLDVPSPSLAEHRPELGALATIVDRCLRKRAAQRMPSARDLLEQLEAVVTGRRQRVRSELGEPIDPFTGLAAFQEADAGRFFGREREVASVLTQLRSRRLVAVVGPSGAGKSSFVRAGVIPALKRSGQRWLSFTVRPGRQPLAALARLLGELELSESGPAGALGGLGQAALVERLRTEPGYLGTALRVHCRAQRARLLLFVDQFEELYTQGTAPSEREGFVSCLEGVADDESSPLRLALSLRSDFLDRVADDRSFKSEITRGLMLLSPMDRGDLHQVLTRPVSDVGYRFESDEMVDTLLDDLAATRSPLPLLQFTAARLWDGRDRQRELITWACYERLGGVAGALASHADAVLAGLSGSEQGLARAVLTSLVTDERTRAIVSLTELRALAPAGAGDAAALLVHQLAAARLVLIESDSEGGGAVELCHESLIERWPKLGQWLDENQDDAAFLAQLRAASQAWERGGRTEDLLWRGRAASEAGVWLERRRERTGRPLGSSAAASTELGTRDRQYLQAVVALAARARRRQRRLAAVAFAVLGVIAVAVAVLAVRASTAAERAEQAAVRARSESTLARNATRMAAARDQEADPTLVLALLRELEPSATLPERWADLARWALHAGVAQAVLGGHESIVSSAAFSPDGRRIATASYDRTVRVWRVDGSAPPVVLRGHQDRVSSAVFSPDGRYVVTASYDGTARVWDVVTGARQVVLTGHSDRLHSAALSQDGARIVTASDDGTARVWSADGSGVPIVLGDGRTAVYSADFSPDGRRVVTAAHDGVIRVWNADGSGQPVTWRGHEERVLSAAFSPDGQRIVTASYDKTARVWDADGGGEPIALRGHRGSVRTARFSPDGRRVVTASHDGTARVWRADGHGQPVVVGAHPDFVYAASFGPRGEWVITASRDRTARVWRTDRDDAPIILRGHRSLIRSAAFSPDGQYVVTASFDRTARVYRADGSGEPVVLRGHEERVNSALFSPDGQRVVTASEDRTARVWNADGSGEPMVLRGHRAEVTAAAFSSDGERIVTASHDTTARVWPGDGDGEPVVLRGHSDRLYSAGFSPDGRRVVTASFDGTARVFPADGDGEPVVLRGHQRGVTSAAFSPDGRRIATASFDTTIRVWNADGSGEPVVLTGHDAVVSIGALGGVGAFDPDGRRIASVSNDKTIRVWNTDGTGAPLIVREPDIDASLAAFSPDGTRLLSGSHSASIISSSGVERIDHAVWVWTMHRPLSGPGDPRLWAVTRFCPSVEQRIALLGVSEQRARDDRALCLRRVASRRLRLPKADGG